MGVGGAPVARHISDSQNGTNHTSNSPAPSIPVQIPTVNRILSTTRQVMQKQEEVKDTNDSFYIIINNDYNTESDYYYSLYFTQLICY